MSFRIQLDCPLTDNEEESKQLSIHFIEDVKILINKYYSPESKLYGLQARLINDNDRTARNYLDKDSNGKARTSKCKLFAQ